MCGRRAEAKIARLLQVGLELEHALLVAVINRLFDPAAFSLPAPNVASGLFSLPPFTTHVVSTWQRRNKSDAGHIFGGFEFVPTA